MSPNSSNFQILLDSVVIIAFASLIKSLDVCWWYLCVLSKCALVANNTRWVWGLCRIAWDYFQLQQNCLHDLRLRVQKAVTPLLTLGGQNVKFVNQYKHLGIVLDTELSDDKDIQRQLRYQYCAANKLRASFSRCSNAVKNVGLLFRSLCRNLHDARVCITIMV